MNEAGENYAYLRLTEENAVVEFIQFTVISFSSWLFESNRDFIREFWVADKYRGFGHGTRLLRCAEEYFVSQGVYKAILTTDTAGSFYIRHGYRRNHDISIQNDDAVFVKSLR